MVIITGMHRSGTSLAASLFHHAGLHIGDDLIGPDEGNSYGYFEDAEIMHFHERLLKRSGQSYLVQNRSAIGQVSAIEREEATRLVSQRNRRPVWGFKDPRAALFLTFWNDLIPDARFVFLYRHPFEVVLSLLRRGHDYDVEALADPLAALRAWEECNRAILSFYDEHQDRAVLAHIGRVVDGADAFVKTIADKLRLSFRALGSKEVFSPTALSRLDVNPSVAARFKKLAPGPSSIYRDLERAADLALARKRGSGVRETATKMEGRSRASWQNDVLHLMSALDPEAALKGRLALDRIRTSRITDLESKRARLEERGEEMRTHKVALEKLVSDLGDRLRESHDHAERLHEFSVQLETKLQERSSELEASQGERVQLEARFRREMSELEQRLLQKEQEAENVEARIASLEKRARESQRTEGSNTQQIAALEARLDERTRKLRRAEVGAARLQKSLEKATQLAEQKEGELHAAFETYQKLDSELTRRSAELDALRGEKATLELHLAGMGERSKAALDHVANLERDLVREQARSMRRNLELESIQSTRAWRWALKWYAIKRSLGLLPRDESDAKETEDELDVTRPSQTAPTTFARKGEAAGKPRVLFISHDAKRHGAQILLLHFLRWFKSHTDIPFEILLKADGELRSDFEELAPITIWNEDGAAGELRRRVCGNSPSTEDRSRMAKFDLIYCNTATNGQILESLSSSSCPVICHVHELDYFLSYETERGNTEQLTKHAHHYIAVSQAVKSNLVRNLHIAEGRIDVVHEFIPARSQNGLYLYGCVRRHGCARVAPQEVARRRRLGTGPLAGSGEPQEHKRACLRSSPSPLPRESS